MIQLGWYNWRSEGSPQSLLRPPSGSFCLHPQWRSLLNVNICKITMFRRKQWYFPNKHRSAVSKCPQNGGNQVMETQKYRKFSHEGPPPLIFNYHVTPPHPTNYSLKKAMSNFDGENSPRLCYRYQKFIFLQSMHPNHGRTGGGRQPPQFVGQTWTVGQYSFESRVNVCRTLWNVQAWVYFYLYILHDKVVKNISRYAHAPNPLTK